MGIVKDVSHGGLALEVHCEIFLDLVIVSFVDVGGKTCPQAKRIFLQLMDFIMLQLI
jgi:hypothetical protein